MIYFDTNSLLYLNDAGSEYHESVFNIFSETVNSDQLALSDVVLIEFFQVITNASKVKQPWTVEYTVKYIKGLMNLCNEVHFSDSIDFISLLAGLEKFQIMRYDIYDHLIYEMMKRHGVDELVTANSRDFKKYKDIKLIIPEKKKSGLSIDCFIPYGRQNIDSSDINAVVSTLKSDYLTQGPAVTEFEKIICDYTGALYCVAMSNATAALHIAVMALDIEPGKEGITSPNTFVASSNCFIYNGLKPAFADIDPCTYNIDPEEIKKRISGNTKVIIPVHFAGRPCDMVKIKKLADEKGLYIIEDAAHAIGSNYPDGSKVGNCKYSDMTIFSFHPVKTITTGEGGAITTNSKEMYDRLVMLRSHGITKDPALLAENPGPWYYEMQGCGYNYRLTDIQSALGISQMKRLDEFKKRRNEIIEKYNSAFSELNWLKTPYVDKALSCFHLYVVQIDFDRLGESRAQVMDELKRKNIGTQVHYIPVHTQPYYRENFGYKWGDYPVAEAYYGKALSLPLYPLMKNEEVDYVINEVTNLFQN